MAKLSTLSLDELYAKPKKTKAIELAIIAQSDFSAINDRYCENICKLNCKTTNEAHQVDGPVDILIIQDHRSPPGKYDRRPTQQDDIQDGVLAFIAKEAGLTGLTFRLTSLLKCPAKDEDFPSGKPPTQTKLQKCFPYLEHELSIAKPKVIVSLGTATTKALGLSKHSNTGNRGEVAFSKYGPVIITLHPRILTYIRQNARGAAGMWGPDYLRVIQRDLEKAGKIARGLWKPTPTTLAEAVIELTRTRIVVAKSIPEVKDILARITALPESAVISFDTETNTLDPLAADLRLLTIQFGWKDPQTGIVVAGVIPLWHRKNTFYDADEAWSLIAPLLLGPRGKVGHNSKFDILVIFWAKQLRVANVVFDTLLMMHSIESGIQGCYGLKRACWDHLYEEGYAGYENELGDLKKLQKVQDAIEEMEPEDDLNNDED